MTPHPAAPAGTTCPACGAGTPAAARFGPACGQRLLGEVAAGEWSGDLRVTGPAVHTAARIQQAAEPNQILLSARTLRAARDTAEVGPAAQPGPGTTRELAATRAGDEAAAIGAHALARRLAGAAAAGQGRSRTGRGMGQ